MTVPPWERAPAQPPSASQPPVPPPYPVQAVNPKTGEMVAVEVPVSLSEAIQQAINGAVTETKGAVMDKALEVKQKSDAEIEAAFKGGPVTARTFFHGLAVDLAFAGMAVLATASTDSFNLFDKSAWTVVGVMLVKTLVQTTLSYVTKAKVATT